MSSERGALSVSGAVDPSNVSQDDDSNTVHDARASTRSARSALVPLLALAGLDLAGLLALDTTQIALRQVA